MVKFAEDVIKEIEERGSITVPEGCVTGEAFEEWLREKNECVGCKFDLTDRVSENEIELVVILERCDKCKRAKLPECQDGYEDLYLKQWNL